MKTLRESLFDSELITKLEYQIKDIFEYDNCWFFSLSVDKSKADKPERKYSYSPDADYLIQTILNTTLKLNTKKRDLCKILTDKLTNLIRQKYTGFKYIDKDSRIRITLFKNNLPMGNVNPLVSSNEISYMKIAIGSGKCEMEFKRNNVKV